MQRIIHTLLSYSTFFSLCICSHITLQKWQRWVPVWKRNVFVSVESNIAYSVFMHCCFTTTPLIIITVCSVEVSRTVSRSNRVFSLKNNPELLRVNVEEAKVTKRLVAVVVGFACCWLPIFIVDNIDMAHGEPTLPRPAYLTYGFLVYLSSTINPFMYCATGKRFRREY